MSKKQYTKGRSSIDTTVALINTIAFLCTQLSRRNLNTKEVKKAIDNLQNDENAFGAFTKLTLTKEDIKNREYLNKAVERIKLKQTLIEITDNGM